MIKRYKCKNTYSIISSIFLTCLAALFIISLGASLDWVGILGIIVFTVFGYIDAFKNFNLIYELYDDKIIVYQGKKQVKTMRFSNVKKVICWGYMHVPLCWKGISINDGKTNIVMRYIGCAEYKDLWIRVYDLINEQSKGCNINTQAVEVIEQIKKENV